MTDTGITTLVETTIDGQNVFVAPEDQQIKDALMLSVNLIRPSASNANRFARVPKQTLVDLAENIKLVDVMQPIVVRPITAPVGQPQYEIVCGECRWYSSKLAGKKHIPARVRILTDLQALQLQAYENLHRVNPHAFDEAEMYQNLLKAPPHAPEKPEGLTVQELMRRTGKSRAHIYQRLSLLRLVPSVTKMVNESKMDVSVATLLSRLPQERQAEAAKRAAQGWGGAPMTVVQAKEYIERELMLTMTKAPFPIKDESLLPKAGSCEGCPKRTTTDTDLFSDVKQDMCSDAKCYNNKREAHTTRLAKQAKAEGVEVITGKDALKIVPHAHMQPKGFVKLDEPDDRIDAKKPLSKLLGKDCPQKVLVEHPTNHTLVAMVKLEDAMRALKEKGLVKSTRVSEGSTAKEREAEAARKADVAWRTDAAARILTRMSLTDGLSPEQVVRTLVPELAARIWLRMGSDDTRRFGKLIAEDDAAHPGPGKVSDFEGMEPADIQRCLIAMLLAPELYVSPYSSTPMEHPSDIMFFANLFGMDVKALRAERMAAMHPEAKSKASKAKPGAKKAEGRSAPKKEPAAKATRAPSKEADSQGALVEPVVAWPFPSDKPNQLGPIDANGRYVGQYVQVKSNKKRGTISELSQDGTYLVSTPGKQSGVNNLDSYSHAELLTLPGQPVPV